MDPKAILTIILYLVLLVVTVVNLAMSKKLWASGIPKTLKLVAFGLSSSCSDRPVTIDSDFEFNVLTALNWNITFQGKLLNVKLSYTLLSKSLLNIAFAF